MFLVLGISAVSDLLAGVEVPVFSDRLHVFGDLDEGGWRDRMNPDVRGQMSIGKE